MPEENLRRALGRFCLFMGLAHLLPVAFVWLSSGGPSPLLITARQWSFFFFIHFLVFVAGGIGIQAWAAARAKLFYGGPLIDFLIGVGGFMLLESVCGAAAARAAWAGLIPGAALFSFGLRLGTGRALLGP